MVARSAFNRADCSNYTAAFAPEAGLIDAAGFSAISTADRYSSHAGWTEWTSYTGGGAGRLPLAFTNGLQATARGYVLNMTEADKVVFTMTASGSIQGAIVAIDSDDPTFGSARLLSLIDFGTPVAVTSGGTLTLDYQFAMEQSSVGYRTTLTA